MGRRRKKGRPVSGWLILDKPLAMTSTQAVGKARRLFDAQKAGHAGTLDPLATGILPIAFGEATKTMTYAVDGAKTYRFVVRWGMETTTDDSEGEATQTSECRPRFNEVEALLPDFMGLIDQVPPKFSAIKVDGERAYDLARDGEDVELAARSVRIDDLRLIDQPDDDHMIFEADCGKGTYVRSLARDMGRQLGCHGHISELRRLRVGPFDTEAAVSFEDLESELAEAAGDSPSTQTELSEPEVIVVQDPSRENFSTTGHPLDAFLHGCEMPLSNVTEIQVAAGDAATLSRGQAVLLRGRDAPIYSGEFYATHAGRIVALGQAEKGLLHPKRVFNL